MLNKRIALMMLLVVPPVLLAACVAAPTPGPAAPIWQALQYAPAPADNPLKGFMPFYDAYGSARQPIANDFPHSMEWFYVPLKNLMNGPDSFTFDTGLEPQLASIASRGHQAAFRVYLDYPGRPSGIPQFLRDGGLTVHAYPFFGNTPDASVSPDYDDPKLAGALESFITALGKRYDGDPRIGFITVGLIGFWGEWHTWPMDGFAKETSLLKAQPSLDVPNWMPSQATQLRILQAFDQAFNTTRLLVRYPAVKPGGRDAEPGFRATYQSVPLHIGYHDDSFAYETAFGRDWYFMGKMEWRGAINKWQTEPIGGELRPEIQLGIWLDPPPVAAEDFNAAVDATHASWLIAHALFTSKTVGGPVYERALAGARRLGYELYVSAVKLPAVQSAGSFSVALRVQNTGVAPFYYDWPIELGVLDASHQLVATWRVPWRLSTLLPASVDHARFDTELNYTTTAPGLGSGNYTLLMRVVNPLPNGRPLKFANATQDLDLQDWLTLGRFEVTP
jgi:hypothetical protein